MHDTPIYQSDPLGSMHPQGPTQCMIHQYTRVTHWGPSIFSGPTQVKDCKQLGPEKCIIGVFLFRFFCLSPHALRESLLEY